MKDVEDKNLIKTIKNNLMILSSSTEPSEEILSFANLDDIILIGAA